jgi:carboxypeptidase C (cathepsin A)
MQASDLYVTGESYAGHYVPAFSAYIDSQIKNGDDVNFKGCAVGDGYVCV